MPRVLVAIAAMLVTCAAGCAAQTPRASRRTRSPAAAREAHAAGPCDDSRTLEDCRERARAGLVAEEAGNGRAQTARGRLDLLCRRRVEQACWMYGSALERGLDGPKDLAGAARVFASACEAEDAEACVSLGVMYGTGTIGHVDDVRSVVLYARACGLGSGQGCVNLGDRYSLGRGTAEDKSAAADAYRRACDLRHPEGCRNVGIALVHGKDAALGEYLLDQACSAGDGVACHEGGKYRISVLAPRDERLALQRFERGCVAAKHADSCEEAAELLGTGAAQLPRDEARAVAFEQSGCALGSAEACASLAQRRAEGTLPGDPAVARRELADACAARRTKMACVWHAGVLFYGGGGAADTEHAREVLARACDQSDAHACRTLGIWLHEGIRVQAAPARGLELLRKACADASGAGCTTLGEYLLRGQPRRDAADEAVMVLSRGCDLGYPEACTRLGRALWKGQAVKRDWARARPLFERGCAFGGGEACLEAGRNARDGLGGPSDKQNALGFFLDGCNTRTAKACIQAAQLHEGGRGLPADPAMAAELHRRACELGEQRSCGRAAQTR